MEILVHQLFKKFRQEYVVRDFNYHFESGKSYAITGPNGSGKSTLLQLISQFTLANSGKVEFVSVEAENAYACVSFAAPYVELIEEYTLAEHLDLLVKNQYLAADITIQKLEEFLELNPGREKFIKNYSSGMRQKIKLGFALLSTRPLLLLDEPTTNFDVVAKQWFFEKLANQRAKIIIIASNEPKEIAFCTHQIAIMDFK
jgi:ABC-type multidrug transport system ATPase subunit